jgi:hypothetical protein
MRFFGYGRSIFQSKSSGSLIASDEGLVIESDEGVPNGTAGTK